MGWWDSDDGTGLIGDRPADLLGRVLSESFGDRYDPDLLAGFLSALGGALLRNPDQLLADPPAPGTAFVAEIAQRPPLVVRVAPPPFEGGLDDAVFDALEQVAFQYREFGPQRLPTLAELLDTVAFVARAGLDDDDGAELTLVGIRSLTRDAAARELADPDWRARMAALFAIGHLRARELAADALRVEIPPLSVGLREDDRRALLALRDMAAARARGERLERPVHPDPALAARRRALLEDLEAALDGAALPAPGSPAYVVHALIDPDGVRRLGAIPPEWRAWLAAPAP